MNNLKKELSEKEKIISALQHSIVSIKEGHKIL
jgi:hypothetical protein